MANYYFLAASLPPLAIGQKPDITFEELTTRLEINLTKHDFEKTVVLRRFIDLNNIRSLLLEEPIDPRGNLDEKMLDEALLIKNNLPTYVFDFLDRYENASERIKNFSALISLFFAEEIPKQTGFLQRYLTFEKEWRLVMIGFRSKALHRDPTKELQFEDFSDPIVALILAQRDSPTYMPPSEYEDLIEKLEACGNDPWMRYRAFAEYRFHKIEEMVEKPLFSIDWILAYMAQLIIVEQMNELDAMKGKMILDTFKAV